MHAHDDVDNSSVKAYLYTAELRRFLHKTRATTSTLISKAVCIFYVLLLVVGLILDASDAVLASRVGLIIILYITYSFSAVQTGAHNRYQSVLVFLWGVRAVLTITPPYVTYKL